MNTTSCALCPRECRAHRGELSGGGRCGMGATPVIARAALHFDEEPCISGTRGSGTIFFSGCPLGCAYCQNAEISHARFGKPVSASELCAAMHRLIGQGAHNVNLVTAGHFAPAILRALASVPPVPIVWNSSGYEKVNALKSLEGAVDVYLPDYKYDDEDGARLYSNAPDYPRIARAAIREMLRQTGPVRLDAQGIMRRGVMVRHLILPGRARQSMRALDFIAGEFGVAWVSLMAQYVPYGLARGMKPLDRPITRLEYDVVVNHLLKLGLTDGYVQEREAADVRFIPAFDLTGV